MKLGRSPAALDAGKLSVFSLFLLAAVASLRHPLVDTDLWWHLKTGEWIVEHRAVPWQDPFSYTAAGHLWIAYSWLAELLFYGLFRAFGLSAILELKTIVVVAMVGLVYLACRAVGARSTVAVATTALATLASCGGWGERPQMFTLLCLALLSWMLRSPKAERRLWWLGPLLIALWANVHILFIGGVALLAAAALCAACERRPAGGLLRATLFSALASLLNPYGWRLLEHLPTMASQPRIVRAVSEFQSPDFGSPLGIMAAALLFFSIGAFAFSRARPSLFELVTFFGPLALGLYMVRNLALFAILAAPTVARHLEAALPAPREEIEVEQTRTLRWLHWTLVIAGLGLVIGLLPSRRPWREMVEPGVFPIAAADFVAAHQRPVRIFTHFNWGGFVIFRFAPGARVAMDGRTQVYGQDLLRAYLRTQYLLDGWEEFLDRGNPDVVLWPTRDPLANVLRKLRGWRVEYQDETAVVLSRASVGDPGAR